VLLALVCTAPAASGSQANSDGRTKVTVGGTDFKVVIWYRRDRPLETFKYQVYDLRRGEYTPAVDAWVELVRTKYTAYHVALHRVDLADEQGDTESLKVGSVVKRELMAAAALEGVVIGYGVPGYQVPTIAPTTTLPARMSSTRPPLQGSTPDRSSYLNPPGASLPFPVPYPRPHP
jgi:hypothetical protein